MKTTTCSRPWRGNWSRGTVSGKPLIPFGKLLAQNIRSCFQRTAHDRLGVSSEESSGVPVDTLLDPANFAERAPDSGAVFVVGQRAESLSTRRRRGTPVVPEQASLFGFS